MGCERRQWQDPGRGCYGVCNHKGIFAGEDTFECLGYSMVCEGGSRKYSWWCEKNIWESKSSVRAFMEDEDITVITRTCYC